MDLKFPFLLGILGSSGSGKTHSVKYILNYYRREYDFCLVISPTSFNGNYDMLKHQKIPHKISLPLEFDKQISVIMRKQKILRRK